MSETGDPCPECGSTLVEPACCINCGWPLAAGLPMRTGGDDQAAECFVCGTRRRWKDFGGQDMRGFYCADRAQCFDLAEEIRRAEQEALALADAHRRLGNILECDCPICGDVTALTRTDGIWRLECRSMCPPYFEEDNIDALCRRWAEFMVTEVFKK
jgi:hypothetical protein